MNIEFTAHELLERKEQFLKNLKTHLEERLDRDRKLALPILRQLIAEFNKKAENEYEENYVDLDRTPIPTSLRTEQVIEFVEEEFSKKGFIVKPIMKAGRTFVRVSWEHQVELEEEMEHSVDLMIRNIVQEEINKALTGLKK